VVTTIPLRYLDPEGAARFVMPYILSGEGRVSVAGGNIRGITLRETADVTRRIEALLREQDRARMSVVLRFQLIRATDTLAHDSALADVDSTLRSLLRFKGNRLAGEALTVVDERQDFRAGLPGRMSVDGEISGIDAVDGRVQMKVSLSGDARMILSKDATGREVLISTGLTVPMGHTVVLGTSNAEGSTYVLTVRPERAGKGKP
jgi:hypothetical protein